MRLPEGHPIVPVCAKCGRRSRESFVIRGGAVEPETEMVMDIEEGWRRAGKSNEAEWLARAETGDRQPWPRRQGSFIRPCRCGNNQEMLWDKFQQRIREASELGEDSITF